MELEIENAEKTFGKREMFLAIGCARYPYSKIKELFGDSDALDLQGLSELPISDDEKVQAIQETGFFSDPLQRVLALRFASTTFKTLREELSEKERELCGNALDTLTSILLGAEEMNAFEQHREAIQQHINSTLKSDIPGNFKRIATLENVLAVGKSTAIQSLRESSSIQRDVLGEEVGKHQLHDMMLISRNYENR